VNLAQKIVNSAQINVNLAQKIVNSAQKDNLPQTRTIIFLKKGGNSVGKVEI
jgi:rhodanese-related sulfurtransferase